MVTYLSALIALHLPVRDEERGASAVEYGLLIAGIAAIIAVAVFAFGDTLSGLFDSTGDCVGGDRTAC
ncbi:Flp family type IVb pilin [Nocardioides bruguierae]|uniref:Flp family type IVb pilin n=1 Tax=Nocardioides bruguierae TaxID=2945102 RepID=A0A9X2IGK7_9ACTN|nr:Flp family type IVb pilin [Nocardioides bruguierae]MCL8027042.1 Flp family type IVb pilin [Nocardioides bruguierae]MCM0621669.1 Flp family type IVb pilin [Nocardioides bruguierae]